MRFGQGRLSSEMLILWECVEPAPSGKAGKVSASGASGKAGMVPAEPVRYPQSGKVPAKPVRIRPKAVRPAGGGLRLALPPGGRRPTGGCRCPLGRTSLISRSGRLQCHHQRLLIALRGSAGRQYRYFT